jgi:hypothetical protein
MTLEEAEKKYGVIKNGKWADEEDHCVLMAVPDALMRVMINSASHLPTHHIYANKDMAGPLARVFQKIVDRDLLHEVMTFDGCLEVRDVRGQPGHPSAHSYALAIDLNAVYNPLGRTPTMAPEIVECFKEEGFAWGGDFNRRDGMHFSYAWE